MGPGSAEQREERCAASGTRAKCGLSAFPSSNTSDKPPAVPTAFPGRSAARSGALQSRGPSRSVEIGPGSAEQREGRCTAERNVLPPHFLHQTRLTNLQRYAQRSPDAAQRAAVRCRAGVHPATVTMGPGSAEQREERCTASGTRAKCALAAFLHQTRLTNLQRCPQRSPDAAQRAAVRCRAGVHPATVTMGPGSAEQREGRCTASGTRAEFTLAAVW
jgi:hypothetical protein